MIFDLLQDQLVSAEALVTQEKVDADRLIECFCELQDARIDSLMGGPDRGAAALLAIRHDLPSIGGRASSAH